MSDRIKMRVIVPESLVRDFAETIHTDLDSDTESMAVLCGKQIKDGYIVTTALIVPQVGTHDTVDGDIGTDCLNVLLYIIVLMFNI